MGAKYILRSADEVDTPAREHYPQFWDMYVHYCEVVILHAYGGCYADLDVLPNKSGYEQARLTVCIQPSNIAKNPHFFEMEVLVAAEANALSLRWLEFMQLQIADKPFDKPKSFWRVAKMRYIYQTTGPSAMRRFLRLPANKAEFKQLQYLHINRPEKAKELTLHDKKAYDAISFQSMSYRTKAVSLPTMVAVCSVDIPPIPIIAKTRLAKKMRLADGDKPHEQAEPIATAPQTADQRDSELEKEEMA